MAVRLPVLALDIGGTKLATAVVTPDGRTHGFLSEPTRKERGPDEVIAHLFDLGRRSMAAAEIDDVAAVGISCGGPLDAAAGVLTGPLHLPGWIDIPIVALAESAFGVPAVLENDATAAVLGEFRYGAARGAGTALYLTISTGIGGGAIIGGRLHRGAAGNGGEFGHVMVRPGGRLCQCGRLGCLEAYASGTSIADRARDLLSDDARPSMLRHEEPVRAEHVSRGAAAGDELARELWDDTTELLAQAITDLVNAFEPHVVVLGGGVTRSGAMLLEPISAAVRRDAMPPAGAAARIALAELGDEVCVVGAAALAMDLAEVHRA
ncbi:ROK family protein [Microbacterium sp. P02]|uniref:ROK family protein n=1 Tax=unclassified Microbacterium TaxID=2609290 RepID=UPI00366D9481